MCLFLGQLCCGRRQACIEPAETASTSLLVLIVQPSPFTQLNHHTLLDHSAKGGIFLLGVLIRSQTLLFSTDIIIHFFEQPTKTTTKVYSSLSVAHLTSTSTLFRLYLLVNIVLVNANKQSLLPIVCHQPFFSCLFIRHSFSNPWSLISCPQAYAKPLPCVA